ncbi:MAG TPA: CBS domain-containing protein [Kosmotogaceae bacterium]|nr:MAG: CBS-domain-containing membrane protein [Thermotogales bacterium 46_20]HAA84807.1 CBS domain-containing protein [Kosmotogaceae bacterium]
MLVREAMIRDVSAVFEDETIETFTHICLRKRTAGLPVVDEYYRVIGFMSETDIIRNAVPSYFSLLQSASFIPDTQQFVQRLAQMRNRPVIDYMKKPPIAVADDDTVMYAADLLIKNGLKTLPVVDEQNRLIGIVTRIHLIHAASHGTISE